jgi:hypothetical protein
MGRSTIAGCKVSLRIFSLWDWYMQNFNGRELCYAITLLERLKCHWEYAKPLGDPGFTFGNQPLYLSFEQRSKAAESLEVIVTSLRSVPLDTTAEAVAEFHSHLRNLAHTHLTTQEFGGRVDEIHRALIRELKQVVFFSITKPDAELVENPRRDWEEVIVRFPKTQIDVDEASYCLAFERYGAAIFHVLLVAELGVIELAKAISVGGDKPGWGSLERIDQILRKSYSSRSDIEKKHTHLLEQLQPLMLSMKNSWRHKITHVDNKLEWIDTDFSPQIAKEIISAVRGFMRRLAQELPSNP